MSNLVTPAHPIRIGKSFVSFLLIVGIRWLFHAFCWKVASQTWIAVAALQLLFIWSRKAPGYYIELVTRFYQPQAIAMLLVRKADNVIITHNWRLNSSLSLSVGYIRRKITHNLIQLCDARGTLNSFR